MLSQPGPALAPLALLRAFDHNLNLMRNSISSVPSQEVT